MKRTRLVALPLAPAPLAALALLTSCGGGQKAAPASGGDPAPARPAAGSAAATAELVFPEEAFRQAQPAAGRLRDFQLPEMKRFQVSAAERADSIDVFLVEQHDLPTVSMDLNLDGGDMLDPPGKVGLASLCMDLLAEGTQKLEKIAFHEALADLASEVSSYSGDDRQGVSMRSLSKSLEATFALFADTVTEPGLRQVDLDRMVKRRLEALKQARASAASVVGRLSGMVGYGRAHPFGRVPTEKTLRAIRLADCKRYLSRHVRPRGARLFIVGDTTEADVRRLVAPLLARWKGAPARVARPPGPKPQRARIYFVHIPGAVQSSVAVLHAGPDRLAPDYFPTMLLAQVLGGGFTSRINMNLRENKGYSYGAGAGFRYSRFFGLFIARSDVRSDATVQSLIELRREMVALQEGQRPPTADELARDKEGTVLRLPASFATAGAALGQYRSLVYFGLPFDYYGDYVTKVEAVTAKQVAEAGAAHLKPNEARFLIVGDGDAAQIAHHGGEQAAKGKDRPLLDAAGKPLALRAALARLAADQTLGPGGFVELDADGVIMKKRN